ncbi:hypothetical protein ANO11243_040280 [Dothideomycetidae sp. 11243]|nr:hypothetical protein ANO11243_040280 [fungal sp. No.11243]
MAESKDNPLPQILNPSDLPTRQRKESFTSSGATGHIPGVPSLFASLIPRSTSPSLSLSSSSPEDSEEEEEESDPLDAQEIYDLIAPISDPEHPLSLGALAVVNLADIHISPPATGSRIARVAVEVTPTIAHCSLATVIGLAVRVRLERALHPRYRVDVAVKKGTHSTAEQVNKQLADKERVAAAMENGTLAGVVRRMLATCV